MTRLAVLFMAVAILVAIPACTNNEAQQFAGINRGVVDITKEGDVHIEVVGGKENDSVMLNGTLPDGTQFTYTAVNNRAFVGQATRADVEKRLAEVLGDAWKETAPDLADTILRVLNGL